jgi:hypothetical protein
VLTEFVERKAVTGTAAEPTPVASARSFPTDAVMFTKMSAEQLVLAGSVA